MCQLSNIRGFINPSTKGILLYLNYFRVLITLFIRMNRFLMRLYPYAKVVDDSIASGLFTIWTMLVDMLGSTFTVNVWYLQLTLKPGRVAWKCLIISAELTNRLANSALNSIFLQKYNMVTTFNLIECNLQLRLGKSIVVSQYCNTYVTFGFLDFLGAVTQAFVTFCIVTAFSS